MQTLIVCSVLEKQRKQHIDNFQEIVNSILYSHFTVVGTGDGFWLATKLGKYLYTAGSKPLCFAIALQFRHIYSIFSILDKKDWYFVVKIVLTYCENKML